MKFLDGILVLSIILLSHFQGVMRNNFGNFAESHFLKPWHFCKSKEVTDPPTPCTQLECSGLCGSLYTAGVGICLADVCECLHSCSEVPPIRESRDKPRDSKPAHGKTPRMDLKPDQISKMALSKDPEHLKPERLSKAALSSNKDHLKPERNSKAALSPSMDLKHQSSKVASSSSKDQLKPDRISKVALTSTIPINKSDRFSNMAQPVQP